MDVQLWCQALSLLGCNVYYLMTTIVLFPWALLRCVIPRSRDGQHADGCTFYEGTVMHARRFPKVNKFSYDVRMALVNLDSPPSWWHNQSTDHLTADEARNYAETDGKVLVLTNPKSAGYIQNPISVYYCYSKAGTLARCIAEVTNTPWGERVTFAFNPQGERVNKSLHVSPFMDMGNVWLLKATEPKEQLQLSVLVDHPQHGRYFDAYLVAKRCKQQPSARNEEAGLRTLLRYGFEPQRIAGLIYWQAVKLLWKGVPFVSPPSKEYRSKVAQGASHPKLGCLGKHFVWRDAAAWPWRES